MMIRFSWLLILVPLFISSALGVSTDSSGLSKRDPVPHPYPESLHHYLVRRHAIDSHITRAHLKRADNFDISQRSASASPRVRFVPRARISTGGGGSGSEQPNAKAAVDRVNGQQRKDKDTAVSDITKAHAKANSVIDQENGRENYADQNLKKAKDDAAKNPNDRWGPRKLASAQSLRQDSYREGENQKVNALNQEQGKDMQAITNFNTKSTKDQTTSFNSDGSAKSDAQMAREKAKAGLLKFLEIFGEVVSILTMAFPGPGEVLGLGLKIAETAGEASAKLGKIAKEAGDIAKMANKAQKLGNDVRKALDLQPGPPVIKGVNGKAMAEVQQQLLNELISLTTKNLGATAKKVQDTAKPQQLPLCPKPGARRVQGGPCRQS